MRRRKRPWQIVLEEGKPPEVTHPKPTEAPADGNTPLVPSDPPPTPEPVAPDSSSS